VCDALQARLAKRIGHKALYMTGFGTAARFGLPDVGLVTFSEMLESARAITGSTDLPLIADADTGYGNPLNVTRTVREYERAGVAALHLEDQQWPKRCGYMQGKSVVSVNEMRQKLRAALDSRRDGMLIIGRTDALQAQGWDAAEERARAYFEEGVDAVFVDGVGPDDIEEYSRRLSDLPLLFNNVPQVPASSFHDCAFDIVLDPGAYMACVLATQKALEEMLAGSGNVNLPEPNNSFELLLDALDAGAYFELGRRYDGEKGK
jgi:2-methylisocitrate lyase-like PEP mutase family enzyme